MSTTLATRPWLPPAVDERTVPAPIDPVSYTVEIDALAELAWTVRPKLITIGAA